MKRLFLTTICSLFCVGTFAQNCIDAVIIHIDNKEIHDTLFCKILSEDTDFYTIDNGYAITTLPSNMVVTTIDCIREMDAYEVYRYEGLDQVTRDYFKNQQTAGNAFRKAAFSTYIATGLAVLGGVSITLGLTVFSDNKSKTAWVVGGSVITAASVFFIIRGWNQIYKAGKLLDLNNNAALYLDAAPNGDLGLVLKF